MLEIKLVIDAGSEREIRALNALADALGSSPKVCCGDCKQETEKTPDTSASVSVAPCPSPVQTVAQETKAAPKKAEETKATPKKEKPITVDELSRAGAELIDQGKMPQLIELLKKYNVQAITQLKPEQYASVKADLIALGAKL